MPKARRKVGKRWRRTVWTHDCDQSVSLVDVGVGLTFLQSLGRAAPEMKEAGDA